MITQRCMRNYCVERGQRGLLSDVEAISADYMREERLYTTRRSEGPLQRLLHSIFVQSFGHLSDDGFSNVVYQYGAVEGGPVRVSQESKLFQMTGMINRPVMNAVLFFDNHETTHLRVWNEGASNPTKYRAMRDCLVLFDGSARWQFQNPSGFRVRALVAMGIAAKFTPRRFTGENKSADSCLDAILSKQ